MLIAREFKKEDKIKLLDMINEINNFDSNFEGLTNISKIINYDKFLEKLEKNKHQEFIKPEYSPQTTFGVFDKERLIGGFNLRHTIKGDLINHGGNIGYLIRPSERKKGYGNLMLGLALKKARELKIDKVLISCREDNIGSAKIIENNGGIYENNYYDEQLNKTYKRYWIYLD
ncbi:MAG: GNAT family N-acetyltransferase [Clostridia bacterium]|nr:GNAT family N-acetyltransferase [Clostridia bacterium]